MDFSCRSSVVLFGHMERKKVSFDSLLSPFFYYLNFGARESFGKVEYSVQIHWVYSALLARKFLWKKPLEKNVISQV